MMTHPADPLQPAPEGPATDPDLDGDLEPAAATDAPGPRALPIELAGLRADLALGRLFPEYSRSRLQAWMREGLVTVRGAPVGVRDRLVPGAVVCVPVPPDLHEDAVIPEPVPLQVIFEDADLLVLHKPAGLVVHPGNGNRSGTLQNGLLYRDPALACVPRCGIVHRLDKDTSGLMVVARTLQAHSHLVRQLQARSVHRHYLALVTGLLQRDGRIEAPIGRHPTQRTRMAVVHEGRPAATRYSVRERYASATLVECRLETGRTHQIRVHMQHLGHALVGDPVYAARSSLVRTLPPAAQAFPRQALHAFHLGLLHPRTGEAQAWEIPVEPDLQRLLEACRAH